MEPEKNSAHSLATGSPIPHEVDGHVSELQGRDARISDVELVGEDPLQLHSVLTAPTTWPADEDTGHSRAASEFYDWWVREMQSEAWSFSLVMAYGQDPTARRREPLYQGKSPTPWWAHPPLIPFVFDVRREQILRRWNTILEMYDLNILSLESIFWPDKYPIVAILPKGPKRGRRYFGRDVLKRIAELREEREKSRKKRDGPRMPTFAETKAEEQWVDNLTGAAVAEFPPPDPKDKVDPR